jgi:hypothetical protein
LETPNEIRKGPECMDSGHPSETHSARLPAFSENLNFIDVLKAEDYQTPTESHQTYVPDATRYANLCYLLLILMPALYSPLLKRLGSSPLL